jgi:hypothetical protein
MARAALTSSGETMEQLVRPAREGGLAEVASVVGDTAGGVAVVDVPQPARAMMQTTTAALLHWDIAEEYCRIAPTNGPDILGISVRLRGGHERGA